MEGEAQVMHAVITVGEPEVDVTSTELHRLLLLVILTTGLLIGCDDVREIDGRTVLAFEHTTLQPYLERS